MDGVAGQVSQSEVTTAGPKPKMIPGFVFYPREVFVFVDQLMCRYIYVYLNTYSCECVTIHIYM